jgi:type I restriction enzyme M protein
MADIKTKETADEFVLFSQEKHRALTSRTIERDVRGKPTAYAICLIRQKGVQLKPEERTRQLWLARLINTLGYAPSRIQVEHPITFGRDSSKRADSWCSMLTALRSPTHC